MAGTAEGEEKTTGLKGAGRSDKTEPTALVRSQMERKKDKQIGSRRKSQRERTILMILVDIGRQSCRLKERRSFSDRQRNYERRSEREYGGKFHTDILRRTKFAESLLACSHCLTPVYCLSLCLPYVTSTVLPFGTDSCQFTHKINTSIGTKCYLLRDATP